jgi:hypothetical protein
VVVSTVSYETPRSKATKLIGSTRQQSIDLQEIDLLAAGVRRDDLYVDHGISSETVCHLLWYRPVDFGTYRAFKLVGLT